MTAWPVRDADLPGRWLVTACMLLGLAGPVFAGSDVRGADEEMLDQRVEAERAARDNPYIITQHRSNYILAHTTMYNPNQVPYQFLGQGDVLDRQEVKYQLSIKAPFFIREANPLEGVFGAFTVKSWAQLYNGAVSKPFRETNYEPEVFYQWAPAKQLGAFEVTFMRLGFNHQSNGQSAQYSRSWERFFASVTGQHKKFFTRLKVWVRRHEQKKSYPGDPRGDDNPDIDHYMGNFELTLGTKIKKTGITALFRNNLNAGNNKRYTEINITYPFWGRYQRFDWVLQYANGYGESLIDYDHKLRRIGIGLQLKSF